MDLNRVQVWTGFIWLGLWTTGWFLWTW